MSWTEEKSLQLIELYKQEPILWNPKDIAYYNKPLKNEAWREIGETMNIDAEECKHKLLSLLASHRRERSKEKKHQEAGNGIYQSTWYAFEALSFLSYRQNPRKRPNSIIIWENEVDEHVTSETLSETKHDPDISEDLSRDLSSIHSLHADAESPEPKRMLLENREEDQKLQMLSEAIGILGKSTYQTKPVPCTSCDEEYVHFGNFIGSKLKKYSPSVRSAVEQAISDIIFKADRGDFN